MKIVLMLMSLTTIASLNVTEEWDEYKTLFKKVYMSEKEESKRIKAYMTTKEKVEKHNKKYELGGTSFVMEVNKYADWFPEELKILNGFKPMQWQGLKERKFFKMMSNTKVPETMDWVEKGAVTRVKNQGRCGSCYAFSAVGALEGLMYVTNNSVTDLSAQELVDCTDDVGNFGCDGGFIDHCFQYVGEKQGISSSKSYPYKCRKGSCKASQGRVSASCTDFVNLKESEKELKCVVGTRAPVSIAFAVSIDFMFYKQGIYDGHCAKEPNHAMLAVGYGKDNDTGMDYWLVKNSWGLNWGEKGYVRIIRGVNKCGIADYNSYPIYTQPRNTTADKQ